MKDFFDNQQFLKIIWKRKYYFIIIGIIAILISAVFSGPTFIKPKFKSTARIYPTNIWTLSNESETEQMLEIVNSQDIKLKMIETFKLDNVYGISKADPLYMTYILDLYNTNVGASKTEFETVEISVLDHNAQRASDMCDSIIQFYNEKVGEMHAIKSWEVVETTKKGLDQKNKELDSIIIEINELRNEYQILDYKTQVEEVTKGYMNSLANNNGNTADSRTIRDIYETLTEKGAEAYKLERQYDFTLGIIDSLTIEYEFRLSEAQKKITYCHIVEYPIPADKKAYPTRWLIVFISTISTLFLALLLFIILDYKKSE